MSANTNKLIEEIGSMSVLELANLVKALEEAFGVSAAMPVAAAAVALFYNIRVETFLKKNFSVALIASI